ncbi:hypothetical protein [Streptomyces sp. NPDC048411]|uniref:hypothetical protein n=1 Tax=Streptomyces sp. NPDC048411 TaxID=3157206 RepID=UPI0034538015
MQEQFDQGFNPWQAVGRSASTPRNGNQQATTTTAVRNLTGHPPCTFDDFLADSLQPLLAIASQAS